MYFVFIRSPVRRNDVEDPALISVGSSLDSTSLYLIWNIKISCNNAAMGSLSKLSDTSMVLNHNQDDGHFLQRDNFCVTDLDEGISFNSVPYIPWYPYNFLRALSILVRH